MSCVQTGGEAAVAGMGPRALALVLVALVLIAGGGLLLGGVRAPGEDHKASRERRDHLLGQERGRPCAGRC
jgi:hypothetical protein